MAGLRPIPTLKTLGPASPARIRPTPPPPGKSQGRPLLDLEHPVMAPRGPALLKLGTKRKSSTGGPGEKPQWFSGSGAEWVWAWASAKYFNDPKDPTVPFTGGIKGEWSMQVPEDPAAPRAPGGSVTDFVYYLPSAARIMVRIEGFYWHLGQGGSQMARDAFLVAHAGTSSDRIVSINDGDFMGDSSGQTAIHLLADVLANRPHAGAIQGGTVKEPRYVEFG